MTQTTPTDTATLPYARGDDRLPMLRMPIDPTRLINRWRNTDADTKGISEVTLTLRDGQLYIHAVAAGADGHVDWGEVPVILHADLSVTGGGRGTVEPMTEGGPTPHYADLSATDGGPSFLATYHHGFMQVHLQGRFNIGILPIVFFNEFLDDSGRADYVQREVFVR
jgi:hypothetical protein